MFFAKTEPVCPKHGDVLFPKTELPKVGGRFSPNRWPISQNQWLIFPKAFNVLRRPLVRDVMCHCGVDRNVVDAWLRGLDGMERHLLLVAGNIYRAELVYRSSSAAPGVPEGDPLSVVAMFCMCWFFALWMQTKADVMPLTYADNWQVLATEVRRVLESLPFVAQFLECCALPISPSKCWMWSTTAEGRRRMRAAKLNDDCIPVQLQAVDLGADLPYCKAGGS